jgi:hypothetical protein
MYRNLRPVAIGQSLPISRVAGDRPQSVFSAADLTLKPATSRKETE